MEENINTQPNVVVEKENKNSLKIILIVVFGVLILFSIIFVLLFFVFNIDSEEVYLDVDQNEEIVIEEEGVSGYVDAINFDASAHTDIRLKNYEGLYGDIFLGFEDVDDEIAEWIFPVIVSYYPKQHIDNNGDDDRVVNSLYGPYMQMEIVNRNSAQTEAHRITFQRSLDTILERDLNIDAGHLHVFRNYLYGGAAHKPIKEINNLEYPNVDNVFSVFLLGGFQDGPWERSENIEDFWGLRFMILVFGVKGDNLITLTLRDQIDRVLDLSIERHYGCIDFKQEDNDDLYDYDLDCIKEILESEEFNQPIKDLATQLIDRFAIL